MKRLIAIILTYNRDDFIEKCVASIAEAGSSELHVHMVVMDNGSTDGTPAALARSQAALPAHASIEVHRTEDNRPVPGALNRGFRIAREQPADYLMMMNDDTEFLPGALRLLVEACDANPDAVLMPLHRSYREPERIDANLMKLIKQVDALVEDAVMQRPLRQVYPMRTVGSAAMLARAEVWRDIGPWDETFWFYGLDDDYCNRALYLGYRNLLVPGSHLFHAHGKLGARKNEQDKAGQRQKWRRETQARFWFTLKNSRRPFPIAVAGLLATGLSNAVQCLFAPWPWGAWQSLAILAWFLPRLPELARIRRRDFDPERHPAT